MSRWRRVRHLEWTKVLARNADALTSRGGMSHRMRPRIATHLGHDKDGNAILAMVTPRVFDGNEKISKRRYYIREA